MSVTTFPMENTSAAIIVIGGFITAAILGLMEKLFLMVLTCLLVIMLIGYDEGKKNEYNKHNNKLDQ